MAVDRAADAARLRAHLAVDPRDAISWHNLASAEGDLGHADAAENAARRALALGIGAPETRFVLARALQDQGRLDEAERLFEECVAIRPGYPQAHRDLAQLRWMRSGERSCALEALDTALAAAPGDPALHLVRSIVLEFAGDAGAALASAEAGLSAAPADVELLQQAAHVCAELGHGTRAISHAQRAMALAPAPATGITLCEALLAAGRLPEAESVAAGLRAASPLDQHAIALQASAWRLLGDPRYAELHDYSALVAAERMEAPAGWLTREAFLADLGTDLASLHRFKSHPFQQSVRGGSQLPLHEAEMSRPVVRALFAGIEVIANRRLAKLGQGADPFRSRNAGRFTMTGAWSIRLTSGGYHTDHVHPRGWLSAVFYVDIPPEIATTPAAAMERAGWLRFGRAGLRTSPQLPPDGFVQPEPGLLVLFPAYVWHGVERFESESARLSVAFDALPG